MTSSEKTTAGILSSAAVGGGGAQEESGGLPVGVKCCYIYDIQQFFGEIESLHYLSQQGAAYRVRYENTYDKIYRNNYFMYKQPCVMPEKRS